MNTILSERVKNNRNMIINGKLSVNGENPFGRFMGFINGKKVRRDIKTTSKGFYIRVEGKRVYFEDIQDLMR